MPKKDPKKTDRERQKEAETRKRKKLASMKALLEVKKVEDFEHLFDLWAISNVAKAIHMGQATIRQKMDNPSAFKANEIEAIADLIGIEYATMHAFWLEQIDKSKKPKDT